MGKIVIFEEIIFAVNDGSQMVHTMWCRVLGGYSLPFTLRTSSTNLVIQCARECASMTRSEGCTRQAYYCLTQYWGPCMVLFGTANLRASATSSLDIRVAKCELLGCCGEEICC